jgi:hypothetical protein
VAVAIASSNTANNSNVFTKPSGLADGDVLEIRYGSYGGSSGSPTAPAGFTSVVSTSRAQGGGFMSWGIFRKVITSASGEPASYTVGRPPGTIGWDGGEIDRLTGVDTTTPETDSGSAEAGSGSTMSTGAAVDAGADDLLLLIGINNGQSMTNPSGTTQDFELDGGDFEGWHASPGALSGATYTSTLGASTEWAIAWVVVKAAGGTKAPPPFHRPTRTWTRRY